MNTFTRVLLIGATTTLIAGCASPYSGPDQIRDMMPGGETMKHSMDNCMMKGNCAMMDHGEMGAMDMDDMTMGDMTMMLEGKSGNAFDLAFIHGMIPHHEGAIAMAEMALEQAGHEEIKAMARDIIRSQQAEIDQMKEWQKAWSTAE